MTILWFHWAILGVFLVVAELLIPAFVLVWFGLGALIVAGLLALAAETPLVQQLLLWITASTALVFLWFKIFKPNQHKTLAGLSQAQAVGEVGLMVTNVEPFQKGSVRFQTPLIGADVWECVADESISAGTRVKVTNVEGSLLRVTKA